MYNETCDKWSYDTSQYKTTIVSDFNLVCDDAWQSTFASFIMMVGVMFGATTMGVCSDRQQCYTVYQVFNHDSHVSVQRLLCNVYCLMQPDVGVGIMDSVIAIPALFWQHFQAGTRCYEYPSKNANGRIFRSCGVNRYGE